jgi:hypothetical protein
MASLSRVRTVFTGVAGTPWYSNLYFDVDEGSTGAIRVALSEFWTDIENAGSALVSWTVEGEVTVIESTDGHLVTVQAGSNLTGSFANTGNELPWANQFLVNLHTGNWANNRELQGRWNLPGFVTGNVEDGVWSSAATASIQGSLDTFLTAVDPSWVVWSKTHGAYAPVTSAVANPGPAILRSRRD